MMKKLFWGLLIVCLYVIIRAISDQEPPPPAPSDDVIMVYYEEEDPPILDLWLYSRNICLESFIHLNPSVDINHIAYGTKIYLPVNQPCYKKGQRLKFYENGIWLGEPYYADVIFIGNMRINGGREESFDVQDVADHFKVCLDNLLEENYLLKYHFDAYKEFYVYSMDVFIPSYLPPCYPYIAPVQNNPVDDIPIETANNDEIAPRLNRVDDIILIGENTLFTPLLFSKTYNICIEALLIDYPRLTDYYRPSLPSITIRFNQADYPPCYNEQGQRLRYYDEEGQRLETPIYSDLPIYIALTGESIQDVVNNTGACPLDLMRVNQYPLLPIRVDIELFIPPIRPCPEIEMVEVPREYFQVLDISIIERGVNTCLKTLFELNPYLSPKFQLERIFGSPYNSASRIILTSYDPCYHIYTVHEGESIYDIERVINICFEEFLFNVNYDAIRSIHRMMSYDNIKIYAPLEAQPCYNEQGQRLYYYSQYQFGRQCSTWTCHGWYRYERNFNSEPIEPTYSAMQVYALQASDTAYSISKKFNVCLNDLITTNRVLRSRSLFSDLEKHPIFIPQTPPCYDSVTGKSIIYKDDDGNLLPTPQISDHLIYYGGWNPRLSEYFNVCINRILDANTNKYDDRGNANYLGFIIPIDRPPCYDENNNQIFYICYSQPFNFDADYTFFNPMPSANINGTYCYDVKNLKMIAWNQNKRVHTVEYGETLMGIAQKYGVPYPLISVANNLGINNTIFVGQQLIIPSPSTVNDWWWLLPLWALWIVSLIGIGRRIFIRIRQDRKII
ncbi:MAG: LysM domain-containing protein [bacterium]|nr:LysM domain-containing protein [bacterium]